MSEERLQEIKDSVNFQREILLAHNMGTLCVDEEQELVEEIERLNKEIKTILDIADKEKVLVEQHFNSNGEHKEFYEVTFDYDFLKSILVGSDKE